MPSALAELIKSATVPISRTPRRLRDVPVTVSKERLLELESLLHLRDGFRAFDNALILRPSITIGAVQGIDAWNQFSLWRGPFSHASELLFFAEGIHGLQFGIYKDEVVTLDPQTAKVEHFAFKLERWAQRLLEDPALVGQPSAKAWQAENRTLMSHERLAPDDHTTHPIDESGAFTPREDLDLMKRWTRLFVAKAKLKDGETLDDSFWFTEDGEPEPAPDAEAEPDAEAPSTEDAGANDDGGDNDDPAAES